MIFNIDTHLNMANDDDIGSGALAQRLIDDLRVMCTSAFEPADAEGPSDDTQLSIFYVGRALQLVSLGLIGVPDELVVILCYLLNAAGIKVVPSNVKDVIMDRKDSLILKNILSSDDCYACIDVLMQSAVQRRILNE